MKKIDCLFERPSHFAVGAALFLMAIGLTLIGLTVLPFFALLAAIPVFFLAGWFFTAPKSRECTI